MTEIGLYYLTQLFRTYAVGLCLGVSSLAMTNYFYVVAKGSTVAAENRMMRIVYTVLRIGMALVVLSELTTLANNYHIENTYYWTDNPEFLMRITIFIVIVLNALAMQHRKITMWLGPVFAGGSWYAYFFFAVWVETNASYFTLLKTYMVWLVFISGFLALLRLYLTRKQTSRLGDGAL
jgi:hypothetical protein